jgi:hypothetical protein
MYISEIIIHVSGLCHRKEKNSDSFSHTRIAHAPPYSCHHVRNRLHKEMTGKWICRSGLIAWPPRSPDLTPLYFSLWRYVKNIVYLVKINDLQNTFKRRIVYGHLSFINFEKVFYSINRIALRCRCLNGGDIEVTKCATNSEERLQKLRTLF